MATQWAVWPLSPLRGAVLNPRNWTVPGESTERPGFGEEVKAVGQRAKPSVTAGVTRKDRNDKEEAGGRRWQSQASWPSVSRCFHMRMEEKCVRQIQKLTRPHRPSLSRVAGVGLQQGLSRP